MVNRRICFHSPYAIFHRHMNMKMQITVKEWCSRIWCNISIFMDFVHFKWGWIYKGSSISLSKSGIQLAKSYSNLAPTLLFFFFFVLPTKELSFQSVDRWMLFFKWLFFFRVSRKQNNNVGQKSKEKRYIQKQGQSVLEIEMFLVIHFCCKYYF